MSSRGSRFEQSKYDEDAVLAEGRLSEVAISDGDAALAAR